MRVRQTRLRLVSLQLMAFTALALPWAIAMSAPAFAQLDAQGWDDANSGPPIPGRHTTPSNQPVLTRPAHSTMNYAPNPVVLNPAKPSVSLPMGSTAVSTTVYHAYSATPTYPTSTAQLTPPPRVVRPRPTISSTPPAVLYPPASVTPQPAFVPPVFINPTLNVIETVGVENNRLILQMTQGNRLQIKNTFRLTRPTRLVIDLDQARLATGFVVNAPDHLGGVDIGPVRLGQFTEQTVRMVIETPDPDRLQIEAHRDQLSITGERGGGLISHLFGIFGRNERPEQTAAPVAAANGPRPTAAYGNSSYSGINTGGADTQFSNIQRLQQMMMQQQAGIPTTPAMNPQLRDHIMTIARAQLGLSKDTQRDYVIQTFSQGSDNAWCADFVSTVLQWSGGSPWGHLSRVQDIYTWGLNNNRLSARPDPGNVVIFRYGSNSFDHVAFIESVNPDNSITTIGGNEGYAAAAYKTTGSVARSQYSLGDKRILGFVDPLSPIGTLDAPRPATAASTPRF